MNLSPADSAILFGPPVERVDASGWRSPPRSAPPPPRRDAFAAQANPFARAAEDIAGAARGVAGLVEQVDLAAQGVAGFMKFGRHVPGVGAFNAVPGFASEIEIANLGHLIDSLLADMEAAYPNAGIVPGQSVDPNGAVYSAAQYKLLADQLSLSTRFHDWSTQALKGSDMLDAFTTEQAGNRARFVALGGTPSEAPPAPTLGDTTQNTLNKIGDTTDTINTWLPWVLGAFALSLIVPLLRGVR